MVINKLRNCYENGLAILKIITADSNDMKENLNLNILSMSVINYKKKLSSQLFVHLHFLALLLAVPPHCIHIHNL